jgi:hypothetical protein
MSRQLCRLFAGIEAFTVADLTAATMRIAGGSATPALGVQLGRQLAR